ncbi:MAG: nitroreductase family protein [Saprospirales bacterium]|nr:nitroreductase family protein [Saprospirales bacterium]
MEKDLQPRFIPFRPTAYPPGEMLERSHSFYELMNRRRTVRDFSDKPVPAELIEQIILTASTAPSGANKQPWTFCLVSDPAIKKAIREAAEKEEYTNYHGRMSDEWLDDLKTLGTNWEKPFLETAPYLIVVFKKSWEQAGAEKLKNYYVMESVGLATGFLLAAIHYAGLVALTHTPSPMNFLQEILKRPENEKPFLLIPVGYPAENAEVPDISRKSLEEVLVRYP